jgi:hypothetical protein
MKNKEQLELRMYGLVNYQLTGIQKGIQFLHAVSDYGQLVKKLKGEELEKYDDWADNWKTVILLNGGTTNNRIVDSAYVGTMNRYKEDLDKNGIFNVSFNEPDLGDQMTAIAFIVDERVFNKKKYPDFEDWVIDKYRDRINSDVYETSSSIAEKIKSSEDKIYKKWVKFVGGNENVFLRDFLKNLRLA